MRISLCVRAQLFDQAADRVVVDTAILTAVDGWRYLEDSLCNYMEMDLLDVGVVGGDIRSIYTQGHGLELIADYWAPHKLSPSHLQALREFTLGQWSDGLGESGFELRLRGQDFILAPENDGRLRIEEVDDTREIPLPSKIAKAARDGDLDGLREALASGEAIDGTLQGYSGLHLAILYGNVAAAMLLIQEGANPNLLDKDGNSPLHLCALSNSLGEPDSVAIALSLLGHGADTDLQASTGDTAQSFADNRGRKAMSRELRMHSLRKPNS
jgi:hypothetical protein